MEGDIEYGKKDLERLLSEIDQFKVEVESIHLKNSQIAEECQSLESQKTALQKDMGDVNEALKQEADAERAMREALSESNRRLEAEKVKHLDLSGRKARYENTLENASQNSTNLSKRLRQLGEEMDQGESDIAHLETEISKAENSHHDLKENLDKTAEALESLGTQLRKNRESLSQQVRKTQEAELERQKARSQYGTLKKMEENYEWFKRGVQVVMKEWKSGNLNNSGILGLVADVIEPEASYEEAVEAALGEALQYVIVEDQKGGVTAIDTLRTLSGGRGGFIPMNSVRPMASPSLDSPGQGHELLMGHVKIKAGYEGLVAALIGHIRVVGNLDAALEAWNENESHQTIVTQQGDSVCVQGIMTGGSSENGTVGILTKKKEVKDLSLQIEVLDTAAETASARQKELEKEAVSLETEVQQTRQAQNETSQQLVETEKELYRLHESLKHDRRHLEILHLEEEQIQGERTDLDEELNRHRSALNELTDEILSRETTIEQIGSSVEKASENLAAANEKVVGLKLRATTLQAEYESNVNTLRRLTDFQQDRHDRLAQLERALRQTEEDRTATKERLRDYRVRMDGLYEKLEQIGQGLAESEKEYQAIEGALQQNDQALSEVRTRQQETFHKIKQLELQQSERNMSCNHLSERIQEEYGQQIEILAGEFDFDGFSNEKSQLELTALGEKISRMGEVNLTAIGEYDTLSERFSLLTGQRDDLVDAMEALHRIIRKINRISLKRFMRTFKAVNAKVQEVFPRLFEGGTAKLTLTNPRRPLESGVSFFVRPPGKKLTRMSLLSGGEKALSAIALVFSLFMLKPKAFCVLDEIDAPLDESNVSRFNNLLLEIGKKSQVVLITHDKQSMETANALFGVTMEQKGVSKLISLNMTN